MYISQYIQHTMGPGDDISNVKSMVGMSEMTIRLGYFGKTLDQTLQYLAH